MAAGGKRKARWERNDFRNRSGGCVGNSIRPGLLRRGLLTHCGLTRRHIDGLVRGPLVVLLGLAPFPRRLFMQEHGRALRDGLVAVARPGVPEPHEPLPQPPVDAGGVELPPPRAEQLALLRRRAGVELVQPGHPVGPRVQDDAHVGVGGVDAALAFVLALLAPDQLAVVLLRGCEVRHRELGQQALVVVRGDLDAAALGQGPEPVQGLPEPAGPLGVRDEVLEVLPGFRGAHVLADLHAVHQAEEAGEDQGRDVKGLAVHAAAVVGLDPAGQALLQVEHALLDLAHAPVKVGAGAGAGAAGGLLLLLLLLLVELEQVVEAPGQVVVHGAAQAGLGGAAGVGDALPLARLGQGAALLEVLEVPIAHLVRAGAHVEELLDEWPAAVEQGEPERRRVVVAVVPPPAPAAVEGLPVHTHVVLHHTPDQLVAVELRVRDGVVDGQGSVPGFLGLGAALLEKQLLPHVPLVVVARALGVEDPRRGVRQLAADPVRDRDAFGDGALDGLLEQRLVGRESESESEQAGGV
ncbi:hypothetical protein PG984_009456 [Apiospora sp. TS-2023a]